MKDKKNEGEKVAAGGMVIDRDDAGSVRVLVVHRPRYDDWSFPKGGVKRDEAIEAAALREVKEETGIECRIVNDLASVRYRYKTGSGRLRPKVVHYFLMEPVAGNPLANEDESDKVEWVDYEEAMRRLSYDHDKQLLRSLEINHA